MAMPKNTRTILIVVVLAVAAYLVYRWYQNKQAAQQAAQQSANNSTLGTNLNSVNPDAFAGSSSGVTYYQGSTNVEVEEPKQTATATSGKSLCKR